MLSNIKNYELNSLINALEMVNHKLKFIIKIESCETKIEKLKDIKYQIDLQIANIWFMANDIECTTGEQIT